MPSHCHPTNRYPIQFKSDTLKFAERWDKTKSVEVGISTVLINREIAIAATPGEPMHKLQRIWKEQADVPVPLFYGYTYSSGGVWPGYIPDLKSAAYGGYGADASTRIEVGAGEQIMQRHLIQLYDCSACGATSRGGLEVAFSIWDIGLRNTSPALCLVCEKVYGYSNRAVEE